MLASCPSSADTDGRMCACRSLGAGCRLVAHIAMIAIALLGHNSRNVVHWHLVDIEGLPIKCPHSTAGG